ncbi:hypothetical protein H0H93_016075 [Arthromyces matolae]|nr:hypothetical protein H0H93_016075 [Arthromyces matolae]
MVDPNIQAALRVVAVGWPGMKPKQDKDTTLSLARSVTDGKDTLPNKPASRDSTRSAPLLSQDDLFLKKVQEEEEEDLRARRQSVANDYHHDRGGRSGNDRTRNESRNRQYDDHSFLGVKKPTNSFSSRDADFKKSNTVSGTKRRYSEASKAGDLDVPDRSELIDASSSNSGIKSGLSERRQAEAVLLFRDISRLVCQTAEDAISHAKDDKKLKAFTELSSMLSKASPKGPNSVATTLADIHLRHAQGKQRMENNLKAISELWNKAYELFAKDMSCSIDSMLGDAMKKITEATNIAHSSILSDASKMQQRNKVSSTSETKGDLYGNEVTKGVKEDAMNSRRDQKRRRISDIERIPDIQPSPMTPKVKAEPNMYEILDQMKFKIDEQAETLHKLTKENNERLCHKLVMNDSVPSSPPITSDSEEDVFNTAHARIHFGPVRTPEKRLAAVVARRNHLHSSPLRRSPRLSSENSDGLSDSSLSRGTETPDVEVQDEPSSALAIRISKALDNPSPPPSPPIPALSCHSPSPLAFSSPSLIASLEDSIFSTPGLSENVSPRPPNSEITTTPPDLISFTPSYIPAPVFRVISLPIRSENKVIPGTSTTNPISPFSTVQSPPVIQGQGSPFSPPSPLHGPIEENNASDLIQDDLEEEESILISLLKPEEDNREHQEVETIPAEPDLAQTLQRQQPVSEQSLVGTHVEGGQDVIDVHGRGQNTDKRQDMISSPKPTSVRELGSLSPTSNDLLSSLVTSQSPPLLSLNLLPIRENSTSSRLPFPSQSSQPLLPQTPHRSVGPVRFKSPSRPTTVEAGKSRLQNGLTDNPLSTPARRIPIEDAILQGHISPLKGSQLLASSSKAGGQLLSIPTTDSPARRVLAVADPATPLPPKKWQGIRFGSPARVNPENRSSSVEPSVTSASKGKAPVRGGSLPPTVSSSSTLLRPSTATSTNREISRLAKLPFPLVASMKDIPPTIAEEGLAQTDSAMTSPSKAFQTVFSSPVKSSLKQTTSRIPRTVKPYAKPASKIDADKVKATMKANVPTTTETRKLDATSSRTLHDSRIDGKSTTLGASEASSSGLKRKRPVIERLSSSPVKPRPTVTIRQVPRVVVPAVTSSERSKTLSSAPTNPKKPLQQIRRVIDRPASTTTTSPGRLISPSADKPTVLSTPEPTADSDNAPPSVPETQDDEKRPDSSSRSSVPANEFLAPPDALRRTTRLRKVLHPSLNLDATEMKPRRKPTQGQGRGDSSYAELSATALRALTTSNTVRNQQYLTVKLVTEIVRREGDRPETPAVKIKTVVQREQEEKKRQRKERASRRASLTGENLASVNNEDKRMEGDTDDDEDDDSPTPKRHKLGPGDEEVYKTPMRKLKRLKLVDDDVEDSVEDERRVKWDRGLFTTISLDEVKVGTRPPPKDNMATKGCLATAAKALPLDNLGNLLYADAPLPNLVEENIVVKKVVYDNDVEAVEEVVVKNTRTRSKKGKS